MAVAKAAFYVSDDEGATVWFVAGDEVPGWAEKRVGNPDLLDGPKSEKPTRHSRSAAK